jgi:hypothetical protein
MTLLVSFHHTDFIVFGYIPNSVTEGPQESSMMAVPIIFSLTRIPCYEGIPFSPNLYQNLLSFVIFLVAILFWVISLCSFNLHSLNIFHIPTDDLYDFLENVCLDVLPNFNQIICIFVTEFLKFFIHFT